MYCRRNKWNWNNCNCQNSNYNKEELETCCSDVSNLISEKDSCSCGFDDEYNVFPENPMYAQSYVPWQVIEEVYKPEVGLCKGTIFPELVSPYSPGQSMEEIEYIKKTNAIKEGCNKC